ncbi:MAG: hypothetical protein H8D32_02960 [Dehalococcoidia bacterium]|nr:hypothetical protein [Dehalococcoidia bacterium]
MLARSASGHAWEAMKIGAGSPPLKTRYGWLLLTHGIGSDHVYRLGAMLLDLVDPTMVLYRSPNSILAPEDSCETGQPGASWVQNVVFTCGTAPGQKPCRHPTIFLELRVSCFQPFRQSLFLHSASLSVCRLPSLFVAFLY